MVSGWSENRSCETEGWRREEMGGDWDETSGSDQRFAGVWRFKALSGPLFYHTGTCRVLGSGSTLTMPAWTPPGGSRVRCSLVSVDPTHTHRRKSQAGVNGCSWRLAVALTWPRYDTLTQASLVWRCWCSSSVMSAAYGGHAMSKTPRAIRQGMSVVSCAEYKNNFLFFLEVVGRIKQSLTAWTKRSWKC